MSYYGTVAKVCSVPIEKELYKKKGIRVCCEASKGAMNVVCDAASPEEKVTSLCMLCHSHPDLYPSIPFDMLIDNSNAQIDTNDVSSKDIRYLYGMPDCQTHTYDFSKYDWSIYQNGNLMIRNKIYNQTNYCINYGHVGDQGGYTKVFCRIKCF